jgi:ribonuclease HII
MSKSMGYGTPSLVEEKKLLDQGYRLVAGLDEAGRGAWAGPVYAAAVILPLEREDLAETLQGVTDSKRLSPRRREALLPVIHKVALTVGVGSATSGEIDQAGIVPAVRLAMKRAIQALSSAPQALLIDYVRLSDDKLPQRVLPKADLRCLSVAAASIVAKVSRDHFMLELDQRHPGYGFARHKGYGTLAHREALQRLGPSSIHRMSWAPLQPNLPFSSRG